MYHDKIKTDYAGTKTMTFEVYGIPLTIDVWVEGNIREPQEMTFEVENVKVKESEVDITDIIDKDVLERLDELAKDRVLNP